MARMYPERLPQDTISDAERRLFDAFREEFSDDWVVFAGARWLARTRKGGARDGEADFVVAHAKYGVLVIEVKGGGIAHDAQAGRWTSTDSGGVVHEIKDPFKQAADNMYDLRRKLAESEVTREFKYPLAYAVAFPDIWADHDLGLEAPREIVFDIPKVRDLKQAVVDAFRHRRGDEHPPPPGEAAVEALVRLIGNSWQIDTTVGASLMGQEHAIRLLTEEQFGVLDLLCRQRRVLITGCAGSGKTMLAVEKAKRLDREGFRVLLTCYNENLAAWMGRQFNGTGVVVMNFHKLCFELARKAGLDPARRSNESDEDFFNRRLPEALFEAAGRLSDRFDAIIVDEGQDFDASWWLPLQALLEDPDEGMLYIFYDDNQALYDRDMDFPIKVPPFPLTRNCRNTRKIHEAVMLFHDSDVKPDCLGPEGKEPQLYQLGRGADERRTVEELIDRLVKDEHVPQGDIAILTRHRRENTQFRDPPVRSSWSATWDLAEAAGKVVCSTIHAFKGLERPVVIVCGLDDPDPLEQAKLLYVAFSRARSYLVVVGWKGLSAG
jgi:hypothetical protein